MLKSALCSSVTIIKSSYRQLRGTMSSAGKSLPSVVTALEGFASLNLAEKWDNVGLLIEPYKKKPIRKILLTNDLTEKVMSEAVERQADLIISYHPPIFAPLKRIRQSNWKERIVSICLSESIALYSPHTAWDAVPDGVNDWLAAALSGTNVEPIQPHPQEYGGAGRMFDTDVTLAQAIAAVQKHIGLDVHVALGVQHSMESPIAKVAVCAGSGASVLKGVAADLYVTGEMSHHEVLDANHQNITVILCNHSNSERGFLNAFKTRLSEMLQQQCEIMVAEKDEDPIKTFVKN